ncbi:amino acid adenylation domain-containing protein [Streptomyces sp. LaBMicrA B280]|uniref:amino acid adenylation domain-containing protein n=1 Tax=Streptomyces sp. LaBMicrA B280 TaxID=3391001 RepID=UPI003BA7AF9B
MTLTSAPPDIYPWTGRTLLEVFSEAVRDAPHRVAVECGGTRMTLGELDRRSARIADELSAAGIGRSDVVAVVVDRDAHLPAALLAVMRSGAAFVPVDPDHPAQRRAYVHQDAGARATLTLGRLSGKVDDTGPVILVDEPGAETREARRLPPVGPADLAYIMYTSGSTGRPKGVEIDHQSLLKALLATASVLELGDSEVWLSVTSPSFDISLMELLLPLLTGGRLVIADNDQVVAGDALHALLTECRATAMQATPLTWRMLLEAGWNGPLRLAVCAGETMHPDLARSLDERCGDVWNAYGPTETTIYATVHRIGPQDIATVPVGRPLPDTEVRVLDEELTALPPDVVGEVWIGGTGVALGYHGREDLTAERFRTLPGEPLAGRFYRTGDLGRRRADGTFELLGRADDQVKIRGHRIEPGEVENRLLEHKAVENAVVVPHTLPGGAGVQLVAYVRAAGDGGLTTGELLGFLGDRVPKYMVPSTVVQVTEWPRTGSGKIDRNRLPDPGGVADRTRSGAAPRTPTESALARLWEEVLDDGPVSREDNFFTLGGHSLLSMRLISRIRRELGVAATVQDLIKDPVLADLAERVDRTPPVSVTAPAPAGRPHPFMPVSPEQHLRLAKEQWRRERGLGRGTHNVRIAATVDGPLHLDELELALTDVVSRHEALRARFLRDASGVVRQEIAPVRPVRVRRETAPQGQDMALLPAIGQAANEPFDLGSGLLLRAVHWARDDKTGVLLLVCDHSVFDGVSTAIFLDDLRRAYAARLADSAVPWDGPDPAYRTFLLEEAAWLASPEADEALEAWRRELTGDAPYCLLKGLSRPAGRAGSEPLAGSRTVRLPRTVTDPLTAAAAGHGASLAHALLALVAIALYGMTGQERIGAIVPMANRETAESDRLVAYAAHGLPVLQDVARERPFTHQVEEAAGQTMEVLARQRLALAEIVRRLDPEAFGLPVAQPYTMVNFISADLLNASLAPVLDQVRVSPLAVGALEPAAPLIVTFEETPEQLTVSIVHDRRFIEDADAGRLADLLTGLADAAAAGPEATVAELLAAQDTDT